MVVEKVVLVPSLFLAALRCSARSASVVDCKIPQIENSPIVGIFLRPPFPVSPGSNPRLTRGLINAGPPDKINRVD